MSSGRSRWIGIGSTLALLAGGLLAWPGGRTAVLRGLGEVLVVHGAVEPADIIVVSTDADGAGVLEAADLVAEGASTRVAVFADPPDDVVDREFIRRGLPYEDVAAREIAQLRALGVPTPEQIPRGVVGTEDEGRIL